RAVAMTDAAVRVIAELSFRKDSSARLVGRRVGLATGLSRRRRQRICSIQPECQNPGQIALVDLAVACQLACREAERSAPTYLDRNVLLPVTLIRQGWRDNPGVCLNGPYPLAVIRLKGSKVAHAVALEHEVAGGGQSAAIPRMVVLRPPHFPHIHWVP